MKDFTENFSKDSKFIYNLLAEKNIHPNSSTIVALNYTEGESEGYITVNYSAVDVRINLKDINEQNLANDGIKIWRTWTYNG